MTPSKTFCKTAILCPMTQWYCIGFSSFEVGKTTYVANTVVQDHRVQNGGFAKSFGGGHKGHGRFLD